MSDKYDIIIIGGGPGGYAAGIRAAQLGKQVAVVEMAQLGGICTNWGCIPTKALLKAAELYEYMKHAADYGITVGELEFDWKAVVGRSRDVAQRLVKGIQFLFKKHGVVHIIGRGKLTGKHSVTVTPEQGEPYILQADNIIIATGARSMNFRGMEPDGTHIISSKEAMVLPNVPEKLVIIGAGAIDVEFAYLYNVFGAQVTLIEMMPRLLPVEDADVSKELTRQFKKRKITILTDTRVNEIKRLKSGVKVHVSGKKDEVISADKVLVATGVTGNVEDLGLEKLKITVEKSAIQVDEYGRTAVSNIYAIGDVIGPPWLAHVATAEGLLAVDHIAGHEVKPIDYGNIPGCTYCQPQVASVGMTEAQAKAAGHEVKVGTFPFRALGKSLAAGQIDGFTKVIYDAKYGELLGAHIIGDGATDLISEYALGRTLEMTYKEVLETVHPHPSLSEALMEATAVAYGESVNL